MTPVTSSTSTFISYDKHAIEDPILSFLPIELVVQIFSSLGELHLAKLCLLNHKWKQLSSKREFWNLVWENIHLTQISTPHSFRCAGTRYKQLSEKFSIANRFEAAIAACEKCATINNLFAGNGLKDISKMACDAKNYETAKECQMLAKKHWANSGSEAMCIIIQSQVSDEDFLKNSKKLIQSAVTLINENRRFGLKALLTIAQKFVEMKMFAEALECTQLGINDSKICDEENPYLVMAKYMITQKQYTLAEAYAKKLDHPEALYSDIVTMQIKEEKFFNSSLYALIKPDTASWFIASDGLVFGLINMEKYEEAKKIAQARIETSFGSFLFRCNLKTTLTNLGIDASTWLE